MNQRLAKAFIAGYEGLVAWADLLDRINVFPVADADTGTNLRLSLAPLRFIVSDRQMVLARFPHTAIGNSGNIAVSFFQELLKADTVGDLAVAAERGRAMAWKAVMNPQPGTMLTVFDCLALALAVSTDGEQESTEQPDGGGVASAKEGAGAAWLAISLQLREAVASTMSALPDLQAAGVVDAGALGMFIFFDVFLQTLADRQEPFCAVTELFPDQLTIDRAYYRKASGGFCVDALIDLDASGSEELNQLAGLGDSVVMLRDHSQVKLHLHTCNPEGVRGRLTTMGRIVRWTAADIIDSGMNGHSEANESRDAIRIMTDAAGSVSREMAARHRIILLDSYVTIGNDSRPESLFAPQEVYALMREGKKVATAQASLFERHQRYASLLGEYDRILYICVGSAFTGNYATVLAWKKDHDLEDRLRILDSESASGRLGAIAIASARYAATTDDIGMVARFAESAIHLCEEYIFIDRLEYLVAGGRLSRSGGFFGDLLGMKPVITPTRDGARKVGVVRNRTGQLEFALKRLHDKFAGSAELFILLQYTDNPDWVREVAGREVLAAFPKAEIMVEPISLTSGVHIGPGSWALAFMPGNCAICG